MLALWAKAHPEAALRNQACVAALDIADATDWFNRSNQNLQLLTRIGLHSGHISLGNVGAIDHYEYRPTGDIVNTASRMEGLNKYLGTRVLVSKEVLHQLDHFLARELGEFIFAGKSKPIMVYELICRKEASNLQIRSLCKTFSEALCAYRKQSWTDAMERFHDSLKFDEQDGPSCFYLNLCKKYREKPPGEGWELLQSSDR